MDTIESLRCELQRVKAELERTKGERDAYKELSARPAAKEVQYVPYWVEKATPKVWPTYPPYPVRPWWEPYITCNDSMWFSDPAGTTISSSGHPSAITATNGTAYSCGLTPTN